MDEAGVEPNEWIYNSLISVLAKAGNMEGAEYGLNEMKSRGLKPNCCDIHLIG